MIGCTAAAPINLPIFSVKAGDLDFPSGQAIRPVELPPATGGSGALTYSLSPDVPGLTFDADDRTLSGTPTTAGTYAMTYAARDKNRKTGRLHFDINVAESTPLGSILSAVAVGNADGVLRFADVPEPSGGPAVSVAGNRILVAGGSIFLDVEPEPGATVEKLLISLGGETFGYYEIDLPRPAASYRLVGQVPFNFNPEVDRTCIWVTAVDGSGASGTANCFVVLGIPVASGDVEVTLSWDSDADLDLNVADPTGAEVYYGSPEVESGGVLDLDAGFPCGNIVRNEHIAWALASPPPGIYEVRVSYYDSCEAPETNYVVSIYNHGRRTTYSGTFSGPGGDSARGTGRVIAQFEVPGDGPPPRRPSSLSNTYRGSGDQVFVLNPDGEVLDDTVFSLDLGDSSAEVYVIATAGNRHMEHRVEMLDRRKAAVEDRAAVQDGQQAESRPAADQVSARLQSITAFNNFNDGPPAWEGSADPARVQALQARPAVAAGDRLSVYEPDEEVVLAFTVRRVVTDGTTTAALWVADQEWEPTCASRGDCVTQEMVDAVAERFIRPGGNNDIYDWVTTIFGDPWGTHSVLGRDGQPILIPADAADEIHIFLYDIEGDGYPTGPRIVGYFWRAHNFLRQPPPSIYQYSLERLAFFMDSPWLATAEDDTWEITDRRPSVILGTLAHEFQHMIHYYQKPVVRNAISESWLNEQASEVAQDLVADKMMVDGPRAVDYDDPTAGEPENRRERLPGYNLYNDIQITTWDGYLANYSINYALGAYLARNYGGAALYRDIVQSDRSGVGAIEGAVRAQGHDESFLELLTNWAAANLLSDNTDAPTPYQYNTGTWRTSYTGGLEFRLGSINLYNYAYAPGRLARPGPYLYPLPVFNNRTQPPHSNMYTTLGRHSGTLRLSVTAESENRITVVVKE